MDNYNNIFSVSRKEYTAFIEQIKNECKRVEVEKLDKWTTATKVYSIKTNKCLCSRVSSENRVEGQEHIPERYYVFEMPDADERKAPIPKIRLNLETREEVQAFFNAISKMRKEHEND